MNNFSHWKTLSEPSHPVYKLHSSLFTLFFYLNIFCSCWKWLHMSTEAFAQITQPIFYRFLFQRAPPIFEVNHKLEAVDKRNPSLVRAATVAEVNEYRLRIHFDGWDDIYDDWFEADSLDLYPVGWCEKTGHPLETPLSKLLAIHYSICDRTPVD